MHVGRIMKRDLITIPPDTSVIEARRIITEKKIDHLLVVDKKNELLGIISDRDLKKNWASAATALSKNELLYLLNEIKVDSIMTKKTITVAPGTTIERAALLMNQHRINALPVLDNGVLVGVITSRDVMKILLEAIGIEKDSARFTILVKDRIGVIADISQTLKDLGISISSLFTWPEHEHPGVYHLVVRVPAALGDQAAASLGKKGFKILSGYEKDLNPYLPEG